MFVTLPLFLSYTREAVLLYWMQLCKLNDVSACLLRLNFRAKEDNRK